ncbi:acyl-CoA N-acyltransferase [Melanogaster broomeanus]|nr:acyl-CoA N-acyltransferase [Melanogaster broomeanus]
MSRSRDRLQVIQNALTSHHDTKPDPVDSFMLPDGQRVEIIQSQPEPAILSGADSRIPEAQICVGGDHVCTYRALDRTAALILSAVGTPHELTATHVPSYPVLEIRAPSAGETLQADLHITVPDLWAIIYALFVRHREQETIPIVFSHEVGNHMKLRSHVLYTGLGRIALSSHGSQEDLFLSRAAFWQGASTHGYHGCGWLPPSSSLTHHAATPFPSVHSFTRTPIVITAHPLRPPKPVPGEVLYRRYCPTVKQVLEFTYFDIGADDQVSPHLEAFHRWQNDERVAKAWNERGTLEQHKRYVKDILNDPAVLPIILSWDGELMGYSEFVYVKENHVATFVPDGARDWDRGYHILVGEERFRGWERAQAWQRSIIHYLFLADPRTERVMAEPNAQNPAMLQVSLDATMHIATLFDFPYKRSALTFVPRERFFKMDVL